MKLTLTRDKPGLTCMTGTLRVDGAFECFTLEDLPRNKKIPGETAIPAGTYKVILTMSPRFKQVMPLLLDVPNFDGVRIHPGNTDKDTHGCILVGRTKGGEFIGESRKAYEALFAKLQKAQSIELEIRNEHGTASV